MEKLLLSLYFTGNKLDIVHKKNVGASVFFAELYIFTDLKRQNEFVRKIIAFDVDNAVFRMLFGNFVTNRMKEMRFSKPGFSIDKKGVKILDLAFCNRKCGRMREFIGITDDKSFKVNSSSGASVLAVFVVL